MIIEFYIRFFVDMYRNMIDIYSIEKLIIYLKKDYTHTYTHKHTRARTHNTRSYSYVYSFTLKIHLVMYAAVFVQNVCREKLYNKKNS